jgi:predicted nucleic acid-binding protein
MLYLLDTGILLRIFNRADPDCATIRTALRRLKADGHRFAVAFQNIAEFWNVSTRPATSRGGMGLTIAQTEKHARVLERIFTVLPENSVAYSTWRDLVRTHSVHGVQVYDARLVAWMKSHGITHIVSLNASDFQRYPGITALLPSAIN